MAAVAIGLLVAGVASAGGIRPVLANGETRSLTFHHTHTKETATVTFRRNGGYDQDGLNQLNWLLRDWRVDVPVAMDPRLFDILWDLYREAGSREPIHVISAYRSPDTNGMLRQRSSAVAEHSQHMSGKAIDVRLPDVDPARLRAIAMRLQHGGVGYYASSGFVHIDTGSVRAWPRMSLEQLARLFPDGKTVHLPPSGKPLPGYELARAEIDARNAAAGGPVYAGAAGGSPLVAFLGRMFGADHAAEPAPAPAPPTALAFAAPVDPLPTAIPLPPRRPPAGPIEVAAGGWPLAALKLLPAPSRPEMEWPDPDDHRGVLRALLTALEGGAAARPSSRIVVVRARARPLEAADAIVVGLEPVTTVLAGFAKSTEGTVLVHVSGPAATPVAPAREANAGL